MTILQKISLLAASVLFLAPLGVTAQRDSTLIRKPSPTDVVSIGVGLGLDYGGMGMNLTIYPQKNIGFFGGFGYAAIGLGYNAGFKARLFLNDLTKPSSSIFVQGMYGYNAVFKIKNANSLDKMFYGPSVGVGFETAVKPNKAGYWSFGLIIPLRSTEALRYQDELVSSPYIKMEQKLQPVAFSIGFKFVAHKTDPPPITD